MTLWEVSQELEKRLSNIFLKDQEGNRAVYGNNEKFQTDEHWRDYILFFEYFHGDHGTGLGASHQTGWTGLMGKILQQLGDYGESDSNVDLMRRSNFVFCQNRTLRNRILGGKKI